MTHSIRIDPDVEMKTRDGVILRADVIRPEIASPVPAILVRTPYEKTNQFHSMQFLNPYVAAQHGFAMVIQDIRGRFKSEGEWDFVDLTSANAPDGYDCVEWVASEPWCDGHVGMAGGSYVAETQLAAAMADPPSLGCIAPSVLGAGQERMLAHDLPLESMTVGWMAGLAVDRLSKLLPTGEADVSDLSKVLEAMTRPDLTSQTLPLRDLLTLGSIGMPHYSQTDALVANVAKYKGSQEETFRVPALWTTGWYDNAVGAEQFLAMRERAATERARTDTRIIFGGWTHNCVKNFVGSLGLGA